MEFLTLLIVLGLLQAWGSGGPFQRDQWFFQFTEFIKPLFPLAVLRLIALVLLPVLALWFLLVLVESKFFGVLSLLFYVSILLFGLGRGNASENLRRYLSAWDHMNTSALLFCMKPLSAGLRLFFGFCCWALLVHWGIV
jgi:AmpE protein